MKIRQKAAIRQAVAAVIGSMMVAGLVVSVNAQPVTVDDVTDWNTTPEEGANVNIPYLDFSGSVYAGINTLAVTTAGGKTTDYNGFCIDPFHWSANGPSSPYFVVPLVDAPKAPAMLNAFTATEIEDLWAEYYSPTMSSPSAAGLQIAIWELVSSNAVVTDGLPVGEAFSMNGYDYGASADLASLATYSGPAADLTALTGPGQDFVIDCVPDGGETCIMLALTLGALVLARPYLIKSAGQLRQAQAIPVLRRTSA
jgi:hypothetical protein